MTAPQEKDDVFNRRQITPQGISSPLQFFFKKKKKLASKSFPVEWYCIMLFYGVISIKYPNRGAFKFRQSQ